MELGTYSTPPDHKAGKGKEEKQESPTDLGNKVMPSLHVAYMLQKQGKSYKRCQDD